MLLVLALLRTLVLPVVLLLLLLLLVVLVVPLFAARQKTLLSVEGEGADRALILEIIFVLVLTDAGEKVSGEIVAVLVLTVAAFVIVLSISFTT